MDKTFFETRIVQFTKLEQEAKSKARTVSNIRLLVFLGASIGAYFLFREGWGLLGGLSILFGIVGLLILVKKHQKIKRQQNRFEALQQLNKDEIKRMNLDIHDFETGEGFIDPQHPYLIDLDIFGKHSLFQLLNRTVTSVGFTRLGEVLKRHEESKEVIARQALIQELAELVDFRQNFAADGILDQVDRGEVEDFKLWLDESCTCKESKVGLFAPLVFVFTCAATFLYVTEAIPGWMVSLAFVPSLLVFKRFGKQIKEHKLHSGQKVKVLSQLAELLKHIENTGFKSKRGQELKSQLETEGGLATASISNLHKLFSNLDSTNNPVWGFIANAFFLWDARYVAKIEKWRNMYEKDAFVWIEVVAEFDGFISLAGFAHLKSDYAFPQPVAGDFKVEAKSLGHPLIDVNGGARNDVFLNDAGQVYLITGSNMSGKSTFQRTVGLNLVLAQIGLPVCAGEFSFSSVEIFTSMRTIDSIEESTSSFYAELKRLKQLLAAAKDKKILYFIDEILKGTNSEDRHKGAKGIAIQLSKLGVSGFISTHDLYLTELSKDLGNKLTNYSFNSEIVDEKIIFDYKLTDGACKSFNASQLMKNMGIELK